MEEQSAFSAHENLTSSTSLQSSELMMSNVSKVDDEKINLFFLDSYYESYISIPSAFLQSYQIQIDGDYENISYEASSNYIEVDDTGLVKPKANSTIVGSMSGGGGVEQLYKAGDFYVTVTVDNKQFTYLFHVVDYAEYYTDNVINKYIDNNINNSMTEMEKLEKICDFVCQYDYSSDHSDVAGMVVTGEGGNCWSSAYTIQKMCEILGIRSRVRKANTDPGIGTYYSNVRVEHRNVVVEFKDGSLYVVEANYVRYTTIPSPRYYKITSCTVPFQYILKADNTYKVTDYYGFSYDIAVPSQINGIDVTEIGDSMFYNVNSMLDGEIRTITLPDTLTTIGDSCFWFCDNLTSLYIPRNVKNIGSGAFGRCDNLKLIIDKNNPYLTVHNGVLFTSDMCELICAYNLNETSYAVPDGVKYIDNCAFYFNSDLQSVTFPDTLVDIGYKAFYFCDLGGSDIIIPESVMGIGYGAFSSLGDQVNSVLIKNPNCIINNTIENNLNLEEKDYVFSDEKSAVIIVGYPGSTAQNYAQKKGYLFLDYSQKQPIFAAKGTCNDNIVWSAVWDEMNGTTATISGAGALTSVNDTDLIKECISRMIIENGITDMERGNTWRITHDAKKIQLPDTLNRIGSNAFSQCKYLTEIKIPENVTYLGLECFWGCMNLKSLVIEGKVTYIPSNAFCDCKRLETIILPDTLTSIESEAFFNCHSLKDVSFPSSLLSIGYSSFFNCPLLNKTIIPKSVTRIGERAFGWYEPEKIIMYFGYYNGIKCYNDGYYTYSDNTTLVPGLTMEVYANSVAESYAIDNYIDYVLISGIKCDVNDDGEFNVSDIVLLQKWLLAVPNTKLANWEAGDLCNDNKLNVFDLCLMKRKLLNK